MATKAAYKRDGYYSPSSSIQFTHFAQLLKGVCCHAERSLPPFVWAAPDEKDILICAA